jgi:hypothetical protein
MPMASPTICLCLAINALLLFALNSPGQAPNSSAMIHAEPLNQGKVNPKLFGNFVELLNDVAPGMWAEMLNDRSFEGVVPMRNGYYFDGSPDACDREWDRNDTWALDADHPFRGLRSARLTSSSESSASLTQSGLSAKAGMRYGFSGYFRADNPKPQSRGFTQGAAAGRQMDDARLRGTVGLFAGVAEVFRVDDVRGPKRPGGF